MGTRSHSSHVELNQILTEAAATNTIPAVTNLQAVALYQQWNTALSTRLDYALEFNEGSTPICAVAKAWLMLNEDQPALRSIIDKHVAREVLRPGIDQEISRLELAAAAAIPGYRHSAEIGLARRFMLNLCGPAAAGSLARRAPSCHNATRPAP